MNLKRELHEGTEKLIRGLKHKNELETELSELWEAKRKQDKQKRLFNFSFIVCFVRRILNYFF
jgi:hypothetical protein